MDLTNAGSWGSILGGVAGVIALFLGGKAIYNSINKSKNIKNSDNFNNTEIKTKDGDINIHIGDNKNDK